MTQYLATFVKDADARLDYSIAWSKWLASGDTISTVAWAIESGDGALTIGTGSYVPSVTGSTSTVWLEGGTVDTDYAVRARVTTTAGRIDDRTLLVRIRAR